MEVEVNSPMAKIFVWESLECCYGRSESRFQSQSPPSRGLLYHLHQSSRAWPRSDPGGHRAHLGGPLHVKVACLLMIPIYHSATGPEGQRITRQGIQSQRGPCRSRTLLYSSIATCS
jgi:hypothetical protein